MPPSGPCDTGALHVWDDEDGTVVVRGRLAPEVGALLRRALDAAREALYQRGRNKGTPPTPPTDSSLEAPTVAQQQADALGLVAEAALHHELDPGAPGERYQVVVHVDAPALADPDQPGQSVLEGGTHVSPETSRRQACDASRVVMRHDEDGHVVETPEHITPDRLNCFLISPELLLSPSRAGKRPSSIDAREGESSGPTADQGVATPEGRSDGTL